jgi:hypothetical protein
MQDYLCLQDGSGVEATLTFSAPMNKTIGETCCPRINSSYENSTVVVLVSAAGGKRVRECWCQWSSDGSGSGSFHHH